MAVGNIIGKAEQEFSTDPTTTEKSKELDKDAFLKLLVTQLGNQDPLNPMEDKEFTAQLADFSSLEQLTEINKGITSLNEGTERQEMLSAVGFIGRTVLADGTSVSKYGDAASTVYYTLEGAAAHVYVNIFDSAGNILRTVKTGGMKAGSYEFEWDGKDYTGAEVKDGVYGIAVGAENEEGKAMMVETQVSGEVAGVITEDGQQYLRLKDGRTVRFVDVQQVVNANKTVEDTSDDSSGDTTDDSSGSQTDSSQSDETQEQAQAA